MLAVHQGMSWQRRLQEIALAGGAIALGGCADAPSATVPCGNANPDPCICGRPDKDPVAKMLCDEKMACEAEGGVWQGSGPVIPDAGAGGPDCHVRQDAGAP